MRAFLKWLVIGLWLAVALTALHAASKAYTMQPLVTAILVYHAALTAAVYSWLRISSHERLNCAEASPSDDTCS